MMNIDNSKLKRDYVKNPLQKIPVKTPTGYMFERPDKDDLYYLYIVENNSTNDLLVYFGVTRRIFQGWLKYYGIQKDYERIGLNVKKTDSIKTDEEKKEWVSKRYQTTQQKYEVKTFNNRNKAIQTCKAKYGVDNPNKRHISKETLDILSGKDILKKYMVENKILNATDLGIKLGISESQALRYIKKYELFGLCDYSKSVIEREVKNYVGKFYHIENNSKIPNSNFEIDIYVPEKKMGIEINGNYWHSDKMKDKNYHLNKSILAKENGIFLYHIFEYEWVNDKNKVLSDLNRLLDINYHKIDFDIVKIEKICYNNKKCYKASYNDKLICSIYLKKLSDNTWKLQNREFENDFYNVQLVQMMFNDFVKEYKPKIISSEVDIAHDDGRMMESLNFKNIGSKEPVGHIIKNGKLVKEYLNNCLIIYDCGIDLYEWKSNE